MNVIAALAGIVLVILVLWDVFVSMVLTRRATRQLQLTRGLVYAFRRVYAALARALHDMSRRENVLSVVGPLFLFFRFGAWALVLIFAFALLQWAAGSQIAAPEGSAPFATVLYFSGTTFFTVALGDVTPDAPVPRLLNVVEAATGFGFLGLIISYLPVFYQDYARREIRLAMLDEWAGSPPSAGELLRRLGQDHALPELDPFLREWEEWSAELLESHLSYPILIFFRSQHENESWVSALATILDVCALALVGIDGLPPRVARLTFAMARHTAVDLSQIFGSPHELATDRLPPDDLARLRALLHAQGVELRDDTDAASKLRKLRTLYEPYLQVLSETVSMPLPAWLPEPGAKDNWQKTAAGPSHDDPV
ncbi:MAG: two pore domain potassium channel family protein [Chloroflexi bacterium]|nr:MAG: two pore domain potassium channel family protein [Chloroflexota bacterium]